MGGFGVQVWLCTVLDASGGAFEALLGLLGASGVFFWIFGGLGGRGSDG